MKVSRKPRHWILVVLALVWVIAAVVSFANFSGQPDPKWMRVLSVIMPTIVLLGIIYNNLLDKRESGS